MSTVKPATIGVVEAIFLKTAHGQPVEPRRSATAVAGSGLPGDISFGRRLRQVLVVDAEVLDEFALSPGQVRENITVRGVGVAGRASGSRLRLGEVELEVTMDCAPCGFLDSLRPGLQAATEGRRGTLFRVLRGGELAVGQAAAWHANE